MDEPQETTSGSEPALALGAMEMGGLGHEITDDMSPDACPFLNMAALLGIDGEQLNQLTEAFFSAFDIPEDEIEAGHAAAE